MTRDIDGVLSSSAPRIAARDEALQRELNRLVADSEAVVVGAKERRGRRPRVIGLGIAVVLALGVASAASGIVDTPWSTVAERKFTYPGPFIQAQDLSAGTNCKVVFGADASEDPLHPVSKEDRWSALAYARQFVLDFDISSIPVEDAIARYKADYAATVLATAPPDLPQSQLIPEESADEIKLSAILRELDQRLQSHLAAHGFSTHAVGAFASPECEEYRTPDTNSLGEPPR